MKKSNVLMLSYIIFLVYVYLSSIIFQWDGLDRIALAATIAGCFFALADLSNWIYSYYLNRIVSLIEINNSIVESYKIMISAYIEQKKYFSQITDIALPHRGKEELLDSIIDFSVEAVDEFEKSEKECEKYMSYCQADISKLDKTKKTIHGFQVIEMITMGTGFVMFFIISNFDNFVQKLLPLSSALTVIAFALIMMNYFLKDVIDTNSQKKLNEMMERVKRISDNSQKIDQRFKQIKLKDTVQKLIEKINRKDSIENSSEDTNNG